MKKLIIKFLLLVLLASGIAAGFFYYQSINPEAFKNQPIPNMPNIKLPSITTPNINISIPSTSIQPLNASMASVAATASAVVTEIASGSGK